MQKIRQTERLSVFRTLADGKKVNVGELAQNRQGIFFAYDTAYLANYPNLSPFKLAMKSDLQRTESDIFGGLFGVFADSLPDGWGLLLQDRFFANLGVTSRQISPLDRLAFVGDRAIGALSFEPIISNETASDNIDLFALGKNAQQLFEGQTDEVLSALVQAGSSGGARPKAQIFMPAGQNAICRTQPKPQDEGWIVKFTSQHLPLRHEEGLLEAIYLTMATQAGLQPVQWQLLTQQDYHWLAVKRFDYLAETAGRKHVHSLSGLLDASHRYPSVDYFDLMKTTKLLCKSRAMSQLQFRRAIFNLFALNQDDHSKNWAFLQDEQGQWQPSPAYDLTFSLLYNGEHSMGFKQYGKKPPLKIIQELATVAGFNHWQEAKQAIQKVVDSLADFSRLAQEFNIHRQTQTAIQKALNQVWQENKSLL